MSVLVSCVGPNRHITDMEECMRINVDRDICAGHALCEAYAPQLFEVSEDDGLAVPLQGDVPDNLRADAESAAAACPERAITIVP
ncbi:MAG: subB [Aeromicrobium sp.]|nr:subB [Aeromicrobium sp.]